jgi:hypothetical protein
MVSEQDAGRGLMVIVWVLVPESIKTDEGL